VTAPRYVVGSSSPSPAPEAPSGTYQWQSFKPFERFKVSITSTFPKNFNSSNDLNDSKTTELEFDEGSLHSTLSDSHHQRLWNRKCHTALFLIER
jgi:hypothetical protein